MNARARDRRWFRRWWTIFILTMAVAFLATSTQSASAATNIVVNTTVDELNGDGDCSLREAVKAANTDSPVDACPAGSGADTINLPSGTYTLTSGSSLAILSSLNLSGAGADTTIIEAAAAAGVADFRVLLVGADVGDVAVSGVTIRHGDGGGGVGGGGIRSLARLTVSNSTITNNTARFGGGISAGRSLTLSNTTVNNNNADAGGGGIVNSGTLIVTNSTFNGNFGGPASGGAIFNTRFGTLAVTNSTLSGNSAGRGGGIENRGTVTLTNSTISNNTATIAGAGNNNEFGGTTTLKNTIIANFAPKFDCTGGGFTSLGNNLDSDGTCNLTATGDLPNTNPLLGPLADNGGSTKTHELLTGSPAIDAVLVADCTDPDGSPITTDQRGVARPQGLDCDIGAFELEPAAPDMRMIKDDGGVTVAPGDTIVYTLEFDNLGNADATGVVLTDTVPADTTFNAGASTPGWVCVPDGNAGSICTLAVGAVAGAGGGGAVDFAVDVDDPVPTGVTDIVNTASVEDDGTNGPDQNPLDNDDTDNTPLIAVTGDTTPPLCEVQGVNIAHPAPPTNVLVHVQDLGSGLSNVNILTQDNIDNVTFTPAITPGTTDLIEIVADKASEGSSARFEIEVFDVAGNRSKCDPLLVELDRGPSSPRYSTYDAMPQADRYFTISNIGESLLTYVLVNVNDKWFVMPTLLPYEVKTIDIGSALVFGDDNAVTVWGGGNGSQVMISDAMPEVTNTFAYPDEPLY